MSVYVMSAVWKHGPKAHGELLVLLALADFADDEGNCWPSMRAIAEKARMTERGAQKIVRRLEAMGFVKTVVGGGRHGCNQYVVTPNGVRPEHGSPPNVDAEKPRTRTQKPRTRVQETPNGGSPEPSLTIKEPSENHQGDFDAFWAVVPKRVGKGQARRAYRSARKKADAETIHGAMKRYAASRRGQDQQFTVHPATWLNGERWLDEQPDTQPDFHSKISEALANGSFLRTADAVDNGGVERLSAPVQDADATGRGRGAGAAANDRRGDQQAHSFGYGFRRFGGSSG